MNSLSMRSVLLFGAAAGSFVFAAPTLAQEASDAKTEGDIIVTARRVEERLQDVPISITVFTQQELTQRNIAVAADLATYTPSLAVNQRFGPEKSTFAIRGFNQDGGSAPTVGVYFAEVVGVRAQGGTSSGNTVGAGAFTDLENVQVLKGPQGTLFGRNTTGGAILLTPRKPSDKLEGYVEGTYGNYDQVRLQGALNLPLADTFKVRIAAERNKRDGYMRNVSGIGSDNYNDIDYFYGRLGIVAELSPDLENYTVAHYSKSTTNGYASRIIGCATPTSPLGPLNTVRGTAGFSGTRLLQASSCGLQLARQNARGDSLYEFETRNRNPFLDLTQWQVINTTTWRASDAITVKNITSYGEFRERANFDLGSSNFVVANVNGEGGFNLQNVSTLFPSIVVPAGTPYDRIVLDTAGAGQDNAAQSTFTEEFQIQGKTGRLDFVIGGYLEFSRPLGFSVGRTAQFLDCTRPQNLSCNNPFLFGSISESSTKFRFDNHGVFAQGTYNFTDRLALTAGIRYTFDKIDAFANSTSATIVPAGTPGSFIDPVSGVTIRRRCTDSFRHGAETPGLDRSACTTPLVNKSSEPTWLLNLEYKPVPDIMLYGQYARGYRQGGLNFTNPGLETWGPEKMDSYEIGAKTSFRGAVSGYLNVAGFYNDLTDQQVFAALIASPAGAAAGIAGGAGIINAGRSRSYGIEVDASALFFESLRLNAGYTYLNTKVKEVATSAELAPLLVGTPFGLILPRVSVGSPFNNSPEHRLTITSSYNLPVDESLGAVSIGATWVYTSSYINDGSAPASVNGIPLGVTPSTDLINLNFDWKRIAGSPIDLSLFVTNLTKEKFNVASTGAWSSAGVAEILLNQPRFYGVRLRYNFSQ